MPTASSIRGMCTAQSASEEPPEKKKKQTAILDFSKFTIYTLGQEVGQELPYLFDFNQKSVVTKFRCDHLQPTAMDRA